MEVKEGKGQGGADIVILDKAEAKCLLEAITEALIDSEDGWGGSGLFRVYIAT